MQPRLCIGIESPRETQLHPSQRHRKDSPSRALTIVMRREEEKEGRRPAENRHYMYLTIVIFRKVTLVM